MYQNAELMLLLANDTLRGLREEAEQQRLLLAVRRGRRAARRRRSQASVSARASTLSACAPTVAPAR